MCNGRKPQRPIYDAFRYMWVSVRIPNENMTSKQLAILGWNKQTNPTFERVPKSGIKAQAWDAREGVQVTSTRVLISLASLTLHWPCALQFSGGTDGILVGRRWWKWDAEVGHLGAFS